MGSVSNGSSSEEICLKWLRLFLAFNHYFRDTTIINGTEFSSPTTGTVIIGMYSLVVAFGVLGNLLTLGVLIHNPNMRTNRNLFILNLGLSDFFVCLITAPMTLYTIVYIFWPFGTAMCKITSSLQGFNIFLSTFSITAIGFDRYVMVIFPKKRGRQSRYMLFCFIVIWLFSLVLAAPLLIVTDLKGFHDWSCDLHYYICHEHNEIWELMPISKKTYTLGMMATQYCLPLFSLVFVYSMIATRMHSRMRNSSVFRCTVQKQRCEEDRQRRTNLLLFGIVSVFAISWLPLNIFHLAHSFELLPNFHVSLFAFCHIAGMMSACTNPILYGVLNRQFRLEYVAFFEWFGVFKVVQLVCPRPINQQSTHFVGNRNESTNQSEAFERKNNGRPMSATFAEEKFVRPLLRTIREKTEMETFNFKDVHAVINAV